MEDKLRKYVDGLFARTAPSKKAVELKEEMLQNLNDKYSDLITEGKSPEAAYNIAVVGIGDVTGLLSELETEAVLDAPDMGQYNASRQKSAMFTAIAVVLYILSVLPMLILDMSGVLFAERIGVPIMFVMIAVATGLLIYNHMTKPKFHKGRGTDTMVEEFRQWQTGAHERKSLRRAISVALWSVVLALYFIISFLTDAWHVTWIIFLISAACEAFINVFFTIKK